MTRVHVSIGSNLQPRRHIAQALELLKASFGRIDASPVYETRAVGFDGDNFLNLVVGFDTDMTLDQVEHVLDDIERQCGRTRSRQRFAPRTMDLDLLLYGDLVRHDDDRDIPRGEIESYAFVLKPLSDLVPDGIHPETGQTFREMWRSASFEGQALWPAGESFDGTAG